MESILDLYLPVCLKPRFFSPYDLCSSFQFPCTFISVTLKPLSTEWSVSGLKSTANWRKTATRRAVTCTELTCFFLQWAQWILTKKNRLFFHLQRLLVSRLHCKLFALRASAVIAYRSDRHPLAILSISEHFTRLKLQTETALPFSAFIASYKTLFSFRFSSWRAFGDSEWTRGWNRKHFWIGYGWKWRDDRPFFPGQQTRSVCVCFWPYFNPQLTLFSPQINKHSRP